MAQTAEKQIPKTITVNVSGESYSKGYDDAYEHCTETAAPANLYLGYTAQYWGRLAMDWLPFIVIIAFATLLLQIGKKRQKAYQKQYDLKYDISIERQTQAIEIMGRTNALLMEISQKLDKK